MSEFVACPSCHGQGPHVAFVDGIRDGKRFGEMREVECHVCKGAGQITTEHAARLAFGKRVREHRVKVRQETGRDVAERIGVDHIAYNHFEHGKDVTSYEREAILAEVRRWGIEKGDAG